MNRTRITLAAVAAVGMLNAAALAAGDKPESTKQSAAQSDGAAAGHASAQSGDKQGNSTHAPDGFVMVEERMVVLTANEPQNHFLRAAEYLAANSPRQAAAEVRIAAGYLDMQSSRAHADKQPLKAAADDLRQVAQQIQQQGQPAGQQGSSAAGGQPQADQPKAGQQSSAQAVAPSAKAGADSESGQHQQGWNSRQLPPEHQHIGQAFARADLALARHFQGLAQHDVQKQHAVMAGYDLDAAASSLRSAVIWSGQKPDDRAVQAVAAAQQLSAQLLAPSTAGQQQHPAGGEPQGDDAAQPAAARIGGSGHADAQGGSVPADASKAVDQLGSAIDACGQQIDKAAAPGTDAGHAKSDAGKSDSGSKPGKSDAGVGSKDKKQ